ncbi:MAG TPA: putative sugar nucleotidyl transferase [Gemmatimonadaceae bacterium]|nr:putative sugar nucleotidyl transferase [Gemmatimonadaceae bacterium]
MTSLVLYDDARSRAFEPFALTRPASELRAGALLIRERWERALDASTSLFAAAEHLRDFDEPGATSVAADATLEAGTVIALSRFAPALTTTPDAQRADVLASDGVIVAVRLPESLPAAALADGSLPLDSLVRKGAAVADISGWLLDAVWDVVRHLPTMLHADLDVLAPAIDSEPPADAIVLGTHAVAIERGARVEPLVVLDATAGPIIVRRGATVAAFTRLVGPCFIGPDTSVGGGRLATVSIGERCRAHGEMNTAILIGHANKVHEGFVGHSCLGRWSNLGAGTITSNLKNTYGPVSLWTPDGPRITGMQFLGSMIGDHAKTAIGSRLTTGSVIGAGANVFCAGMAPKVIPPFAWGPEGDACYDLERFLAVAERVMARRDVALSDACRRQLSAAFAMKWTV